jgi:hypothetical protein
LWIDDRSQKVGLSDQTRHVVADQQRMTAGQSSCPKLPFLAIKSSTSTSVSVQFIEVAILHSISILVNAKVKKLKSPSYIISKDSTGFDFSRDSLSIVLRDCESSIAADAIIVVCSKMVCMVLCSTFT